MAYLLRAVIFWIIQVFAFMGALKSYGQNITGMVLQFNKITILKSRQFPSC